jgi:site-specific DNA-methyltransferase (cytosine-N4-specific)
MSDAVTELPSPYQPYHDYLAEHVITPFYEERLKSLKSLRLADVLKRKNPYLFKAKNIELAQDLVKGIIDAFLSSQEEGKFGSLLEGFAIFVSNKLYGGFKSSLVSLDLEFERENKYYIVGIKSGTSWGNADQVSAMKNNFKAARESLRARGVTKEIVAVNGCIYGKDRNPLKNKKKLKGKGTGHADEEADKVYYKYAGQDFWKFISGDDALYREIIKPIDEKAKQKSKTFKTAYSAKINEMTAEFIRDFTMEGQIDWIKLIDYVSKRDVGGLTAGSAAEATEEGAIDTGVAENDI